MAKPGEKIPPQRTPRKEKVGKRAQMEAFTISETSLRLIRGYAEAFDNLKTR
jgi:hypothetical protein